MIVEGFDNAWHILRNWKESGYEYFALEMTSRVPQPRPLDAGELPASGLLGLDYLPIPPLAAREGYGDNPDPERPLTIAELALATAIAEGWEPEMNAGA
ncbi:MAG TPA: hypothetical protein VJ842_19715 [Pyrinomonadaceae bacterium]|nr:hypothetical protein [Pyrinomonadaceae bacterium]